MLVATRTKKVGTDPGAGLLMNMATNCANAHFSTVQCNLIYLNRFLCGQRR